MTETSTPTEESVMAMAAAFDAGKDIDTPATPEVPSEKQAAEPVEKSVEQEARAEAEAEAKGDKTGEISKEGKAKETEHSDEKEKSRWTQNRERKERTWQEINAEKEAIKAEKEALAREKEAIQKSKVNTSEPLRDDHGFTADDYRKAAKMLRDKGDEQSKAHAEAAERLAQNMDQRDQQLKQQKAVEEMQSRWTQNYNALAEKNPDLKKQDSELYKATVAVLNEFPLLARDPDGLKYAVRAAEINLQAREFEGTKAEFAKLKSEYDKLIKKTSIGSGSPTSTPAESKTFSQMTLAEQEKWLERAAAQADSAAGYG